MHSEKKLTKEDTWRPADLTRHIREEGDDNERRPRGGESVERRRKDPEKVSRHERDKPREMSREKRHEDEKYRHSDRRKEGSRDRRGDKDKERKDDREKRSERDKLVAGKRHDDDYKRRDREDKEAKEKDKERHRDKERDRERDKERHNEGHRDKRAKEGEKERRTEERDKEHRRGERDRTEKPEREKRDRHRERERLKDEYRDKSRDTERRERHRDKKDLHVKGESEREKRRHKEERERRHREREYKDEKRKHDSESKENQDLKGSGEEVRRHRGDRERAERDNKHRERRQREEVKEEEEKPERNSHRDAASCKKPASDKSQKQDTKTEVAKEEVTADQEYEDDFEDYEEDFEEMDESDGEDEDEPQQVGEKREELSAQRRKEIEAIQRAMDEENERVGAARSGQTVSTEEGQTPRWSRGSDKIPKPEGASQRGKFIDFVTAKQRQVSKKVSTKQMKRSTELLRLIDLDFSMTVSLLDLPPVNEYDMYIRTFGTANTKQAYVQCNEDNADRDVQTEGIETCEKWTQHPPEHRGACGDPNLSHEAGNKGETSFDSRRLTAFLRSASQVMVILLEEDRAVRKSPRKLSSQTDTPSFSDGSLQLNANLSFLYGRRVSLVHFSQVQRHTMMSVHSPTAEPSAVRLDRCAVICIWNIWEPSRPQKVLVYESEVLCCCFSPGKATLVFAGTSVGSVVLWDLREQAGGHYRLTIGEEEWAFRQPTFSTDAVMADSGHFSSVTSVEVVPSTAAGGLGSQVSLLASEEESSGLSFQLASLDEMGVLNFWVVVEHTKANEAGSATDLGLRPGGKVKLLHSSRLLTADRVSPRDAAKNGRLQTLLLRFLPTDSNHFFIGTNMGLVNHETSHGLKAPPKFYRFLETGARPIDVTSIHFSPFRQHLFLVGCGDGSIRLHQVSRERPVAEWRNATAGEAVVSLQWTQTRPAVFCVLDAASTLHMWDLLKNDAQPVVTERMDQDRVTAMTVFGDAGQQNVYSGIALAHESGKIEMQYFAKHFTVPNKAEEEKLEDMMAEAL